MSLTGMLGWAMRRLMLDGIGWAATAIFCSSYFVRRLAALRRIQAVAAALWVVYGVAIGALPVVAANVVVAAAAFYSSFLLRARGRSEPSG